MPRIFPLTVILLIGTLCGCGFHLRGNIPLAEPMHRMYLHSPAPYDQLTRNLSQYLKMSGVMLTDNPKEAETVLVILHEDTNDQLLSVGGTQQTRQYNLILTVTYEIRSPTGRLLVPEQSSREIRSITIESDQILGGSNEETNMYKQMRQAIVFDIMNRLGAEETSATLMSNMANKS